MKQIAMATVATYFAAGLAFVEPAKAQFVDQSQIEVFASRLNLTSDQENLAKPIMIAGFNERMAILQSAGIEPGVKPKLHQMMKLRGPMQASQANTEAQLSSVLSSEQMAEYKVIMGEMRERMRAQFQ